jgi:hypothetical protein
MCQPRVGGNCLPLHLLIAAEHDIRGLALDTEDILTRVKLSETLNLLQEDFEH